MYLDFRISSVVILAIVQTQGNSEGNVTQESRMIQADDAIIRTYPYMVQIINKKELLCGGVIIGQKYVLTAASCFAKVKSEDRQKLKILAGSEKLLEGKTIKVNKIISHERYAPFQSFSQADIALLELKSKLHFSNTIKAIDVNYKNSSDESGYTSCLMAGWGMAKNKEISKVLKLVKLKPMSHEMCKQRWRSIFDSNICAEGINKGASCEKDQGAPMICSGILIGVLTNLTATDCSTKTPEIFTKTANYQQWILDKVDAKKSKSNTRPKT